MLKFKQASRMQNVKRPETPTESNMPDRVVLLFFHGGSFTKECWKPIIKRISGSPLLQRVPCEYVTLDWRFHGERSDYSVDARIEYVNGDREKPRVDHPLRVWMEWVPAELKREIDNLRSGDRDRKSRTRIVGIGHSMGASAMLDYEIHNPGTFDGIVAFEPVNNHGNSTQEQADAVADMLASITLSRPGEWDSWDAVLAHFKKGKMYRRWHPEAIDAFLEQGVRQTTDGKYRLATSPSQEASIYCHMPLVIDWNCVQCPVTIEYAERSYFFNSAAAREVAKRFPDKYSVDAIPNTTHSMVLEDPDTCAQHILLDLERMPVFQPSAKL